MDVCVLWEDFEGEVDSTLVQVWISVTSVHILEEDEGLALSIPQYLSSKS